MKKKYYVVWEGRQKGIFETWQECEKQIKGFKGAKYKSFNSLLQAQIAFNHPADDFLNKKTKIQNYSQKIDQPILESICVDGAYSYKTHTSEYQGVYTKTGERIFYKGPFKNGSNNLVEFLAIVHALAICKKKNWNVPIYSDSKNAIIWVQNKQVNTSIQRTQENKEIFQLVERAIEWLNHNHYKNKILKWDTEKWGENPADFGRK